jgi:hypothetical protein
MINFHFFFYYISFYNYYRSGLSIKNKYLWNGMEEKVNSSNDLLFNENFNISGITDRTLVFNNLLLYYAKFKQYTIQKLSMVRVFN